MDEIQITPVLPQVSTDPKGADIPCEVIETITDAETMLEGEIARQTVQIEQLPEVVRRAPEPRISSWSEYGMNRLMRARTRLRSSSRRVHLPKPVHTMPGEARSSTF
jgi:hypothetical protein